MLGLLNMVAFYIRNYPQVPRVLAEWVARILTGFGALKILLPRVFLGYTHGIEIENVIIRFCEPHDCLVPSGKPAAAVQSVLEVPDDPVAHPKPNAGKDGVEDCVQRDDSSCVNVVANLPANAAFW